MAQPRLYGHADPVYAVGRRPGLPDGIPVISSSFDAMVRVRRLADGTPLV